MRVQEEVVGIFVEYLLEFLFAFFGHGWIEGICITQGWIEDAPPVMAFCGSDVDTEGVVGSFGEGAGAVVFFGEPFFLEGYGGGLGGCEAVGFFCDLR